MLPRRERVLQINPLHFGYDVQVERIFALLEDIHELFSNTYFQEREQRGELLGMAYKKINEEIDRYKESEKRAMRRKKAAETNQHNDADQGIS